MARRSVQPRASGFGMMIMIKLQYSLNEPCIYLCRTGSVVYIDYKAQFQEEAPGSAPQRRKAATTRAKKARQSDPSKKANNKAYFARKGGFKRRR